MNKSISEINSSLYFIAPNGNSLSHDLKLLNSSSYDLIIHGNVWPLPDTVVSRPSQFENKIIVGYIDVAESTSLVTNFYTNGIQNYFGGIHAAFGDLYTVRFWEPAWWEIVKAQINDLVAWGYDGIFLDVLSGSDQWAEGNRYGNPYVPDAVYKMAELLERIHNYVDSLDLDRPFYLIGNNPQFIFNAVPESLDYLDVVFIEGAIWRHSDNSGLISERYTDSQASSNLRFLSNQFENKNVIGVEYAPLDDHNELIDIIRAKVEYGWLPGFQKPLQDNEILKQGPFVTTATVQSSTVRGADYSINYIAEMSGVNATLVGGKSSIDYFLVGDGNGRVITQGTDNIIYMRPQSAYKAGLLTIDLSYTLDGSATKPFLQSLTINGKTVISNLDLTAEYGKSTQELRFDVADDIESLVLTFAGTSYRDQQNFSNVTINDLSLNGKTVDMSEAVFSNGAHIKENGYTYSNNGTVSLADLSSRYLVDSSSVVVDSMDSFSKVVYESSLYDFSVKRVDADSYLFESERFEFKDTLNGVDRLVFTDTNLALDTDGVAGEAYRIYKAAFDRAPDIKGLGYWINDMDGGRSLTTVAAGFIASDEFQTRYGAAVSDADFITLLYANVLDRTPDQSGLDYWINDMKNGMSRAAVLASFSESDENQRNVSDLIANGIEYTPFIS